MIRKYHNHKPQTTPWHHEEEPPNHHETPGRQIKQSNQLSLPHQDDCNTRFWLIYILSAVALNETNISSCLYFSMQNIEMSCDLDRTSGWCNLNVS